jgi:hypothetical protein
VKNATSSRFRAVALLLLVAGFGFMAGIFADRLILSRPVSATAPEPAAAQEGVRVLLRGSDAPVPGGERRIGIVLPGQLAGELDLTAEQQAEIERILREDQEEIRQLTAQFQPQLVAAIERSRKRIFGVLTEEQRARWQEPAEMRLRTRAPEGGRD